MREFDTIMRRTTFVLGIALGLTISSLLMLTVPKIVETEYNLECVTLGGRSMEKVIQSPKFPKHAFVYTENGVHTAIFQQGHLSCTAEKK